MKEITVLALTENVDKVVDFINLELEARDCSIKAQTQIDVAIDELFSNIANYAYAGKEPGEATIQIDINNDDMASITFIDEGVPYNPLEKADPDTTLSAEERGIGGLGIFIVKKSMDNLLYSYENGKNIVTITKKLS